AGWLIIEPGSVGKSVDWNAKATATLTVTNTGTAPATAEVTERAGGFTPQAAGAGAPLHRISGSYSPYPVSRAHKAPADTTPQTAPVAAAGAPWTAITDLPVGVQDNAVETYHGKAYSIGGLGESDILTTVYMYDPDTGAWTTRASAGDARYGAAHGLID